MSAAELQARLQELFHSQDVTVKAAADEYLRHFVETDQAWVVSKELLCNSDPSFQFFGAQTLCKKVQRTLQGYEQAGGSGLKDLVPLIQKTLDSPATTNPSRQQLVLALAAIVVALCTSTWTTAAQDLLTSAASKQIQPKFIWGVLLAIPEQLSGVVHKYLKTDARTIALLRSRDQIIEAALVHSPVAADEAPTGTLSDSEFSLALQTLIQWSKVMGIHLIEHERFAQHLVGLLASPVGNSEVVMDVLLEVLRSSPGAFMIYEPETRASPALEGVLGAVTRTMQALLPRLMNFAECGQSFSIDSEEGRQLSRWARVAGTVVEAYTQFLWLDESTSQILLSFIGACFMVHPHVSQSVFELWAILKDANHDGKLPPGVLSKMLQQLTVPCSTAFIRFGRYDSWYSEDEAELVQLRGALQEILTDMYCIAQSTPESGLLQQHLHSQLQQFEANSDVVGMEVIWFAFTGIAEVLADESSMPEIFIPVIQSTFRLSTGSQDQLRTVAALLRTCGPHFDKLLQANLAPAVQWLVSMVSRIPVEASEAVQELCGYAGQLLLPHVEELLKVVVQVAPTVSTEVDASLHGALAGITRALPADQAVAAFAKLCDGCVVALSAGIDVGTEAGRAVLHRCLCRVLRCARVMEEAGSASSNAPTIFGAPSPASQCAANCVAKVLVPHWTSFVAPCQKLLSIAPVGRDAMKGKPIYEFSDIALQVNILALLRRAAHSAVDATEGGAELGSRLIEFVVQSCKEGQLAPLVAAATVAGSPSLAKMNLLPVLDIICSCCLEHARNGQSALNLVPFLELSSAMASSIGDELFQSPHMPSLTQLCVIALNCAEQDVLKPVLLFLQKLLMSRTVMLGENDVTAICQAIMFQFHAWPRSMNTQSFKVFSAFAERHEAVLLRVVAASGTTAPCFVALPDAERLIAQRAFQTLRGPKFRAFLSDLASLARQENTLDVLQAYAEASGGYQT